jgi:Xaa-Pro aminopeptidase
VVLPQIAGVFIDGRYRTQVKSQIDLDAFTPVPWPETKPADWLRDHLPEGGRIAFDPWLHTSREVGDLEEALKSCRISLCPEHNFIDPLWADRPAPPQGKVAVHPIEFSGETSAAKRARLGAMLDHDGQSAAVVTLPDSLCWLLNIRGADIPRNPVVHAAGILHADGKMALFIDEAKLSKPLYSHLGDDIQVLPPDRFVPELRGLSGTVRVDRSSAPFQIASELATAGVASVWGQDPCILPKALKNQTEIAGITEAHLRDGAAMVEFLCWLDAEAPKGGVTEIGVVTALEGFRRASNALREISFETICGSGPNGAIMHYRVSQDTDRELRPGEIVVIDSGGQYLDGTTDITRTVAIGSASEDERLAFTRVLQGMIAMSRLRWPKGVAGQHLDAIARYALWLAGQDYDHGTGHGVGAYLSVHEGPAGLSRRYDVALAAGMVLSNEPGYYREGAFGIRIENLLVVEEAGALAGGDAQRQMLCFRTLTFAPIDRRLIAGYLLTRAEVDWLDAYHAAVLEKIGPRVSKSALSWLKTACAPL